MNAYVYSAMYNISHTISFHKLALLDLGPSCGNLYCTYELNASFSIALIADDRDTWPQFLVPSATVGYVTVRRVTVLRKGMTHFVTGYR